MKNFALAGSLILLTFLSGCLENDIPDTSAQLALDIQKIEKYLDDNDITNCVKDPSGVFYTIDQAGVGALPISTDFVNMTYVCKLFSGTTAFEQTSIPDVLNISNIGLTGLRVALPKFPAGTKATIYIPSVLAYGANSSQNIPANSNLIFEIEVFDIMSSEAEVLQVQQVTIDNYVLEEGLEGVLTDPSGLRYQIIEEGAGDKPTLANSVTVKYKGSLLTNGTVFDDHSTTSATFSLGGNLIEGWKIGMQLLPEGTKAKLFLPSGLGYKTTGSYNASNPEKSIPGNAILVFDVELIDIL